MFIAAGYISMDTSECHTLKEKRSITRSLIAKTKYKFNNAAIAEVGNADNVKKLMLGVCVVSNDKVVSEAMIAKIIQFIVENSFRTTYESNVETFSL